MRGAAERKKVSALVGMGLALVAGCGDEGGGAGSGGGGSGGQSVAPVMIAFEARVGAEAFDCAKTFTGLGTAKSEATISDFRLYVHDVKLRQADGTWIPVELSQDGLFQRENLALLDFEDKSGACANGTTETNTMIMGTAPGGTYDGVSFVVGVPFEKNHADAAVAPSPLNLTALFWSWNGGYKFLRIDSKATGAQKAFNMHVGSTECVEDAMANVTSCAQPNRPLVEITDFDPLAGKVVIDYALLVAGNDISTDAGGAPGCMSGKDDPECAASMGALGLHADGSAHASEQVVFKGE